MKIYYQNIKIKKLGLLKLVLRMVESLYIWKKFLPDAEIIGIDLNQKM